MNTTIRIIRWFCLILVWAAAAAPFGCADKDAGDEAERARRARDARLDALRSLPYVETTPVKKNEPEGVVVCDTARACAGYRLIVIPSVARAELIDLRGRVVNSWHDSTGGIWAHCELLPGGDLLVVGTDDPPGTSGRITDEERYLKRLSWRGLTRWKQKLRSHHDVEQTPDGKLCLLAFRRIHAPGVHPAIDARDDVLLLLEQDGTVLDSLSLLEAASKSPGVYTLQEIKPNTSEGKQWVDVFHSNSVEWMRHERLRGRHRIYDPGNVLVCSRHQDCAAIFDWDRREVVWSWGQGEISGPHDAQVLENGNIIIFDNGLGRDYSRVIELDPLTKEIVWEYKADRPEDFYTSSKGSAQRLPNGNTLIAESVPGRAFEVTAEGEVVWKYVCPHLKAPGERAAVARITHFPSARIESLLGN